MALRRLSIGLLAVLAAAVAVQPALAKNDVRATLTTVIPLGAPPGTKVKVGWRLSDHEDGMTRPFGAGEVFVRLLSKTGAGAETAYTSGGGTYSATVTVPEGGIRDVQIGLRAFSTGPNGTHGADMIFPITNDPTPGLVPVARPAAGTDWAAWLAAVVVCGAVALIGLSLVRRRVPGVVARG